MVEEEEGEGEERVGVGIGKAGRGEMVNEEEGEEYKVERRWEREEVMRWEENGRKEGW